MQLLYRINRTGTTVLVATHDRTMVDRMRRRVIELERGPRSCATRPTGRVRGAASDTAEFGALMRGEPAASSRDAQDPFDEIDEAWR